MDNKGEEGYILDEWNIAWDYVYNIAQKDGWVDGWSGTRLMNEWVGNMVYGQILNGCLDIWIATMNGSVD